jgi:hypothetical protein
MYQVTYTLRSKLLGDRVAEEISITAPIDSALAIEGEIHLLREQAFKNSASEAFYHEILARTRAANTDLQKAQMQIKDMRHEWQKAADFLSAQGLAKTIPDFPIAEEVHYEHPAIQASTHISGLDDF